MLFINICPLLLILSLYYGYADLSQPYHLFTYTFYLSIYTKRIFEVLFIHKYSGKVTVTAIIYMTVSNVVMAALSCLSILFTHEPDDSNWGVLLLPVPLIIFGLVANFYHHILLARLRTRGGYAYITMALS
jgi:very-long-chain enoyl-CoA reductase